MWRIARFLRIIGDARINSATQDLADFIEWANKETGLSRSMVYFQVFPAHQGIGPGYGTTYAIIGEAIREIEDAAEKIRKRFGETQNLRLVTRISATHRFRITITDFRERLTKQKLVVVSTKTSAKYSI